MHKGLLALALGLSLISLPTAADVLAMPEGEPKPEIVLPAKGQLMADVEAKYGSPRVKQPTVGGGHPQQPPITRWDYDGFAVIFEHDRVVNSVVPGAPPKLKRRDKLQTLPILAPPPPPMAPVTEDSIPEDATPADTAPEDAPMAPTAPMTNPESNWADPDEYSDTAEDPEAFSDTSDAPETEQPPVY